MILPDEIEKLKCFWVIRHVTRDTYEFREAKPRWDELQLGDERICLVDKRAYDKNFEQGVLHERKRAERLVHFLKAHMLWVKSNRNELNKLTQETLDQYLKIQEE